MWQRPSGVRSLEGNTRRMSCRHFAEYKYDAIIQWQFHTVDKARSWLSRIACFMLSTAERNTGERPLTGLTILLSFLWVLIYFLLSSGLCFSECLLVITRFYLFRIRIFSPVYIKKTHPERAFLTESEVSGLLQKYNRNSTQPQRLRGISIL